MKKPAPTGIADRDATLAHEHSSGHRDALVRSATCGCFYCLATFSHSDIAEWIDEATTALCPRCGIDAVIGSACGFPIDEPFLRRIRGRWFSI